MRILFRIRSALAVFSAAFVMLPGLAGAGAPEETKRPNIIFILMDDLRADALGCTGHPFVKTPNIDRIAKEGASFNKFYVSIPLCSPSRGSFLTGQYAHTHGVTNNTDHSALSHKLVTFPRLLHDAGYETAYVGKWHMGTDDSPRPGFDRWVSFKGQGVYENPMINVDGTPSKMTGYMTDILSEYAVDFLKAPRQKPFCLYLSHKAVHGPFTPAERHKDLFADTTIKPGPNHGDSLEGKPALTRPFDAPIKAKNQKKKKKTAEAAAPTEGSAEKPPLRLPENTIRNQLRALAAVDDGVGEIFKALEQTKQLDNTLIIFTSDNGFFWGEHGLADKRWAYEESIRDPLLMRYPRLIKPGTTFEQFALNIDIAPTLLDLAQVPVPKSIQGRSLVPLLKNPQTPWRESFLTEYFEEKQYRTPSWEAVRTHRWKYIHYPDLQDMDELYEIKADPYELKNRIKDHDAQAALNEMKVELKRLRLAD